MICAREGCEEPVPIKAPGSGGFQARYCSNNCRKRACDDRARTTCQDCGEALFAGSRWEGTRRCSACEKAARAELAEAHVRTVAQMYNDGKSVREIAQALGWGENSRPPALTEAARRGLITHRNRGYDNAA